VKTFYRIVCHSIAENYDIVHLFTYDFYKANKNSFDLARSLLSDEESKRIFDNTVLYKLTGRISYLFSAESDKNSVYNDLLDAKSISSYADLGAYNGDTIRELLNYSETLSYAVAFEPDKRSFKKLNEYCETEGRIKELQPLHAAAWSEDTVLSFSNEGNRNSGLFAKGKVEDISARALDSVLDGRGVDYIKFDVEGAEAEAIKGCKKTIAHYRPKLLVSIYHRSEDIFALPLMLAEMCPDYKFYLRRYPYVPAWDLNFICIPN
jgi:FkbM family methyltransferase